MIKDEEIIFKSNNGNKYLVLFFISIMVYAVGWSLLKAPIILCFSIPMLIFCCWTPRITIVTEKDICFYHPYRFYNRKIHIPIENIKSVGELKHEYHFKLLVKFYKKKTNRRFKLNDYDEIELSIKSRKEEELLFDLFKKYNIPNPNKRSLNRIY